MNIILKWLLSALSLIIVAYLIPGISVASFYIALIAALILGILNVIIRPILVILTLPINILTLGLFILVINGVIFWFLSTFIKGFSVDGFWIAVLGALIVSLLNWSFNQLIDTRKNNSV